MGFGIQLLQPQIVLAIADTMDYHWVVQACVAKAEEQGWKSKWEVLGPALSSEAGYGSEDSGECEEAVRLCGAVVRVKFWRCRLKCSEGVSNPRSRRWHSMGVLISGDGD